MLCQGCEIENHDDCEDCLRMNHCNKCEYNDIACWCPCHVSPYPGKDWKLGMWVHPK